jgi:hypothetical protein
MNRQPVLEVTICALPECSATVEPHPKGVPKRFCSKRHRKIEADRRARLTPGTYAYKAAHGIDYMPGEPWRPSGPGTLKRDRGSKYDSTAKGILRSVRSNAAARGA